MASADQLLLLLSDKWALHVPGDGQLARFKTMTWSLWKLSSRVCSGHIWPQRPASRFSCVAVSPGQYLTYCEAENPRDARAMNLRLSTVNLMQTCSHDRRRQVSSLCLRDAKPRATQSEVPSAPDAPRSHWRMNTWKACHGR